MPRSVAKIISILFLLLVTLLGCTKDLSENQARGIFKKAGWDQVKLQLHGRADVGDGKILYAKGYTKVRRSQNINYTFPSFKLMPYMMGYTTAEWAGVKNIKQYYILGGTVEEAKVKKIKKPANFDSQRIVEFALSLNLNEFSKDYFGVDEKIIPWIAEYELGDDGWFYKETLFEKIHEQSSWFEEYVYGLTNKHSAYNSMLWNMHQFQIYPTEYK